jgi:hypothetical protein
MEFKPGDYVVITKNCDLRGEIGKIGGNYVRVSSRRIFRILMNNCRQYNFDDSEFRLATPQETAHYFAEEICNGS